MLGYSSKRAFWSTFVFKYFGSLAGVEFKPPGSLSSRCIEPSVNGEITHATPFFRFDFGLKLVT
jgi:hypothetical protein